MSVCSNSLMHSEKIDLKPKELCGSKNGIRPRVRLSSQWDRATRKFKGCPFLAGAYQGQELRNRPTGHILEVNSCQVLVSPLGLLWNLPCSMPTPLWGSQWPDVQCSFASYLWQSGKVLKGAELLTFLATWATLLIAPKRKVASSVKSKEAMGCERI